MSSKEATDFEMFPLFEMTPDLVCIAGKDGYFRKVNQAVIDKLGYTKEELFSRPICFFSVTSFAMANTTSLSGK